MTKRIKIAESELRSCSLCDYLKLNTGSSYKWLCPIFNDMICETHCCEAQMRDYEDTRNSISYMVNMISEFNNLLTFCENCEFGETLVKNR